MVLKQSLRTYILIYKQQESESDSELEHTLIGDDIGFWNLKDHTLQQGYTS